jgi:hypothetical protein
MNKHPHISITVPENIIAALSIFAARDDIRVKLNGILLEIYPDHAILIATDGHMLGAARIKGQSNPAVTGSAPIRQLQLKHDWLQNIKPTTKKRDRSIILTVGDELPRDDDSPFMRALTIRRHGEEFNTEAEVVSPLEWKAVCPKSCSGKLAQFDPRLLARLGDVYAALHSVNKNRGEVIPVLIAHNADASALVDFNDPDFVGLVMPMRTGLRDNTPRTLPPDWIFESADPQAQQSIERTPS